MGKGKVRKGERNVVAATWMLMLRLGVTGLAGLSFLWLVKMDVQLAPPREMYRVCHNNHECEKIITAHGVECYEEGFNMSINTLTASRPDEYYWAKYTACLKNWGAEFGRQPASFF